MKRDNYSLNKDKLVAVDYKNHYKSTPKRYAFILIVVCAVVIVFGGYIFRR